MRTDKMLAFRQVSHTRRVLRSADATRQLPLKADEDIILRGEQVGAPSNDEFQWIQVQKTPHLLSSFLIHSNSVPSK